MPIIAFFAKVFSNLFVLSILLSGVRVDSSSIEDGLLEANQMLTISITSDFICPWCLIAHSNLQKAIIQLNKPVDIKWYPFQLNPDMPEDGMDRRTYRSQKFGSWQYSQQLDAKTIQAGLASGLEFRYDLMQTTPNTLKAHRLVELAARSRWSTEMVERIFIAYFMEGQNIGDIGTLSKLASEIGLDSKDVNDFLQSDEQAQEIRILAQKSALQGISSVPTIQIGNETLVGGQSTHVFLKTLQAAIHALEKDQEAIKS